MSKLNIYYVCMFALILVSVSGLNDLSKEKKSQLVSGFRDGLSGKMNDNSNNDGEDLIVKKRMNLDEERELEDGGTDTPSDGSTSSTADVTATGSTSPEATTTEDDFTGSTTPETTTAEGTTKIDTTTKTEVTTTPEDEGSGETDEPITTTPQGTGTTTPKEQEVLICPFQYPTYKFIVGSETKTINPTKLNENGIDINYYGFSCDGNNPNITYHIENNVTVKTDVELNNVKCTIKCNATGYKEGSSSFSISIVEYKPNGINTILSKVPVIVNISTPFNVTLALKYPTISGYNEDQLKQYRKDVTLNFNDTNPRSYNVTQNDKDTDILPLTENFKFEWKDLQFNYNTNKEEGVDDVTVSVDDVMYHINHKFKILVSHDKECNSPKSVDPQGLCCERKYKGEYCTKIQGAFSFEFDGKGSFDEFYKTFNGTLTTLFNGSPYKYEDKTNGNDENDHKIRFILTYIENGTAPDFPTLEGRLLEGGIDWNEILNGKEGNNQVDPILFGNVLLSVIAPSENTGNPEEIVIPIGLPPEIQEALKTVVVKDVVKKVVKEITISANENGVKKSEDYFTPTTQVGDNVDHSPEDSKPWAEEYWWVILIICIGAVLIIGIIVAILVVSLSSSGGSKTNKKDLEKSEKIMETVIPIEKIKQENEISDDDIYKPFSYEVIMEGYLLKSGRDRVVGKWQRRYCVLYFEPAVLRIYDSMVPSYYGKVYIDEKQSIPLDCYNGIEYKDGSSEFTLILKVRDSSIKAFEAGDKERKIVMKVEGENSIETAKKWVECFRDFKNQKPKAGDAWTRPLIIDQNNGKISTSTNKAAEKKNEEIVLKAQQRRQAAISSK